MLPAGNEHAAILAVMDTSTWSPWPGTLTDWRANRTAAEDDLPLPRSFLASDNYFQLATRPLFQLWDKRADHRLAMNPGQRGTDPTVRRLRHRQGHHQRRLLAVARQQLLLSLPPSSGGTACLGCPASVDLIEDAVPPGVPRHQPAPRPRRQQHSPEPPGQPHRRRRGRRPAQSARPDLLPPTSRRCQTREDASPHVPLGRPTPRPLRRQRSNRPDRRFGVSNLLAIQLATRPAPIESEPPMMRCAVDGLLDEQG